MSLGRAPDHRDRLAPYGEREPVRISGEIRNRSFTFGECAVTTRRIPASAKPGGGSASAHPGSFCSETNLQVFATGPPSRTLGRDGSSGGLRWGVGIRMAQSFRRRDDAVAAQRRVQLVEFYLAPHNRDTVSGRSDQPCDTPNSRSDMTTSWTGRDLIAP